MYFAHDSGGLHAARHVHCVAPDVVLRLLGPDHPGYHRAVVDPCPGEQRDIHRAPGTHRKHGLPFLSTRIESFLFDYYRVCLNLYFSFYLLISAIIIMTNNFNMNREQDFNSHPMVANGEPIHSSSRGRVNQPTEGASV